MFPEQASRPAIAEHGWRPRRSRRHRAAFILAAALVAGSGVAAGIGMRHRRLRELSNDDSCNPCDSQD
jgi:hypothetical protein